jgi:hypothetical protein
METHDVSIYQRHPLDASQREIRLLHLQPQTTSHLTATLSVKDLASVTYICVSYVWGDPSITKAIEVDGEEMQITTNLFDFLHHIRGSEDIVVLWADAICINQNDMEEKSHQVGMMGDIYSGCSLVHVWLGALPRPLPPETGPFAMIEHFADGKHWHDVPGILEGEDGKLSDAFADQKLAFDLMTGSPWWTRAWTVQEIILPVSAILWYGSYSTTWDRVAQALDNTNALMRDCCERSPGTVEHWLKIKAVDFFVFGNETVNRLRRHHHRKITPSFEGSSSDKYALSFHEILLSLSSRQCKDPRDKVFSVLGLAPPQMFANYTPDYGQSLADCFTGVFRRMLQYDTDIPHVLLGHGFGPGNNSMPSWARDLSYPHTDPVMERQRKNLTELYDCSAGSPLTISVKNDRELHTKARKADTIRIVGTPQSFAKSGARGLIAGIKQSYELVADVLSLLDEAALRKAFMRTICGTLKSDRRNHLQWSRLQEDDLPSVEDWLEFMADSTTQIFPFYSSFTAPILACNEDRCVYVTEAGKLGLAVPGAQPGDEVWALLGMDVPFVLRKAAGEYHQEDTYHLIGDCFLLDNMDGEIMRNGEETRSIVLV